MKKILTISAISLLLLSGCAAAEEKELTGYALLSQGLQKSCESVGSGLAVDQIKVEGAFGEKPSVTFPTPISLEGTQTKEIVVGDGGKILGNQQVALHFGVYNGSTGEEIQVSEFGTENWVTQNLVADSLPNYCGALVDMSVGSRVAIAMSPAESHDGQGIPSMGVAPDAALIFVFDIVDAYLPRANGEAKPAEAGFPTVITSPTTGQPGIQIPASDAPTEFKRSVLIEGRGEEVQIGDTLVLHYAGWTWDGTQFDESWSGNSPATFELATTGLIEGFVRALEGVKVGSQVIAIIPPELGYGEAGTSTIGPNATLIFVIDVLGKE